MNFNNNIVPITDNFQNHDDLLLELFVEFYIEHELVKCCG